MYQTNTGGKHYELGTSGFLYRSSKLMYDHETKSLWSTLQGKPVVGKLVGKDIKLDRGSVVTTTWGKWKSLHPDTQVLSLNTGHRRDYGEGVAYQDYFSTDKLMFQVPNLDNRLLNKNEVLALRTSDQQLAIDTKFLNRNPIYHGEFAGEPFVVLTDPTGANRIYQSNQLRFASVTADGVAVTDAGDRWRITEDALISDSGTTLPRVPSHRAFWFGWFAQFPETVLIK